MHDQVPMIIRGKLALRYYGKDIEAMKMLAKAAEDRSLADFRRHILDNPDVFDTDPVIQYHLDALYDQMLEQNLIRVIEPYSKVQVMSTTNYP
jgi:26S proteasome regulatory subunit N6